MKVVVDNQIVKLFLSSPATILSNPHMGGNQVIFRWPSLLEYLELGTVLSSLPPFEQNEPLFEACILALSTNEEKEVFFHLYDRLFAEILKQISALPQMETSFLLQAIQKQRQTDSFSEAAIVLSPVLDAYEILLTKHAAHTMHDLILYLAWDRMCVYMARLFDYQSSDPKFINGISVLRDCLMESYQHIANQGRTVPGIYRMLEAFLFYEMREENFKKLTDAEWTILKQSFPVLKPQEELVDFFYIDDVAIPEGEGDSLSYLTLDSPETIKSRLSLAQYMMDKIKSEVPQWDHLLSPKKILCVES